MRSPHDIDALVLMATALASKRRPADLVEIVAAADLLQGFVPYADKLGEAIQRLAAVGLLVAAADGFTLTPPAQAIMAELPRKAEAAERIAAIQDRLGTFKPQGEQLVVLPAQAAIDAAVQAHKAARKTPGKNLLMPKPKPDRHFKVEGRWRRAPGTRARKP